MVVEPIHVMDANETTSEAFKNYAGAAFLVGMAVISIGIGAGMIVQAVRDLRQKSSSTTTFPEDLMAELRKRTRTSETVEPDTAAVKSSVQDLKRTVEEILSGTSQVIDQVTAKEPSLYLVKKDYKEPVTVGGMIPDTSLMKKPDSMSMDTFLKRDQLKFKSKTVTHIKGGIRLVTVEEILNSEPVKPV